MPGICQLKCRDDGQAKEAQAVGRTDGRERRGRRAFCVFHRVSMLEKERVAISPLGGGLLLMGAGPRGGSAGEGSATSSVLHVRACVPRGHLGFLKSTTRWWGLGFGV